MVINDSHTNHIDQQIGNYRLLRLLERNELAEIYLAEHKKLHTQVVIKLLNERHIEDDLSKFFVHLSRLSRLRHPHIVQLLDFGMQENKGYLVMEYAPNGTLRQRHPRGSRLLPETVMHYVKQICDALHYIHSNELVHCDIKPQNLLFGANDEVMISDFGVAIVSQSRDPLQTEPYEFAGTVIYAAPEQLQGIPCKSSDQYALGVVSYEWFCGDRPFSGNFDEIVHQHLYVPPLPLRLKNPQLSSAIEQVVMKTLAKKVEARFPSAQAFAEALEWAVEQSPTKLKPKRQFLSPQPFFDDTVAKS